MNELSLIRRVLSGLRPTGKLHFGHFGGALLAWLESQKDPESECFFLVADYQAATTHADNPSLIQQAIKDVTLDMLSVGLDPRLPNVNFVLQSEVAGRADLSLYFDLLASYNEILDSPTVKAELEVLKQRKVRTTMSFVRYPVDEIADVYSISPKNIAGNELLVPAGADQDPLLEDARKIASEFNEKYGTALFRPCRATGSMIPRLVGTDGQAKMSKSLGNTIDLDEPHNSLVEKVRRMKVDPARMSVSTPGDPDKTVAFMYHRAFNPDKDEVADMERRYRMGRIGDRVIKERLIEVLTSLMIPMRERRAYFEAEGQYVDYLIEGTRRASELCIPIAQEMKEAMGLGFPKH